MWLLVLALGVLPLAACSTSLQEIRERSPVRTGEFPQSYQTLARCTYDRLDAQIGQGGFPLAPSASPLLPSLSDFRYRLDDQPERRQARVSATSGGVPSSAMFEITVEAAPAGSSRVEYRRGAWLSDRIDRDTWVIVAACGQAG
jgi:hypothetical protein